MNNTLIIVAIIIVAVALLWNIAKTLAIIVLIVAALWYGYSWFKNNTKK